MKILLRLILILLLTPFTAIAEDYGIWNQISTLQSGAVFYVAPSTLNVNKRDQTISYKMLINESVTKKVDKTFFLSMVWEVFADCKREHGLVRRVSFYSGKFASGSNVKSFDNNGLIPLDKSRPDGAMSLAICHDSFGSK